MDDYVRICPSCGAEHAAAVMRCRCGALLAGIDLRRRTAAAVAALPVAETAAATPGPLCPHDDCRQVNAPGSTRCAYCNRSLLLDEPAQGLLRLPAVLAGRYRIQRVLPAAGAEAEILFVEPLAGGPTQVAKIYRQGILPREEVCAAIARIDVAHCVRVLERGVADGHAYEVMEYCAHGSLRDRLAREPLRGDELVRLIEELASAIAAVHAAGVVHRDIKPENVLVRSLSPLELVLTDFGIASPLASTQRFTGVARSLPYASPESLSGVIDGKCDYWALGMIVLEAATGSHPFAGLSDAVILHHLTTRSIALDGVSDANLKKLIGGLLLRDPKRRWGATEIGRWQAGDASLAAVRDREEDTYGEPYRVAGHDCHTPEQLAVALAENWQVGLDDLDNGQLLAWFRDVRHDQDTVRLLLGMRYDRELPPDRRLLALLLHLTPGLPPVWRGESIELPALLASAGRALKGDAQAARWLHALFENRVLESYALAGNVRAEEVVQRWDNAREAFHRAWDAQAARVAAARQALNSGGVVLYDDALWGRSGIEAPPVLAVHPRLLAVAYDASWTERLRKRLQAELTGLFDCPWLAALGDPVAMDAASLLALEALLPEARDAAKRTGQAAERKRQQSSGELKALREETALTLSRLRQLAQGSLITIDACHRLIDELERHESLCGQLRAAGQVDEPWQELKRVLARSEPAARSMRRQVEALVERKTANAGWLSQQTATAAAMVIALAALFAGARVAYPLLGLLAAIVAWRLLPNRLTASDIRRLARKI